MQFGEVEQTRERDPCKGAPPGILALSARRGIDWTPGEIRQLADWWFQRDQMRLLLQVTTLYLGPGMTASDIEEVAAEFYEILESARISYEPGPISFCTYVIKVCFKKHCWRAGNRIRALRAKELPLNFMTLSGETIEFELEDPGAEDDLDNYAIHQALFADLYQWLRVACLPRRHKEVFFLRYFEELSYEEIAREMNCPVGSVKGWLHRANAKAAEYLRKRGWSK